MLNQCQEKAKNLFKQFLFNKEQKYFCIDSMAGTGKSYLLNHLQEELSNFNKQLQFMGNSSYAQMRFTATTNKAGAVLNDATTVHKLFGLRVFDNYKTGTSSTTTTSKTMNLSGIILVVDEASMINPTIEKIIDDYTKGSKVIFVGDSYQLAPVKHKAPLVFTRGYPTAILTEPMRQDKDSPLYQSCIQLRTDVKEQAITQLVPHANIRFVDADTFKTEIIDTFKNQEDARVLAYTNKQVENLNKFIRKQVHNVEGFRAGDPVVAANALEGKVKVEETYYISSIGEPHKDNLMMVQTVHLVGSNEVFTIPVDKQKYFRIVKSAKAEAKQDGDWTHYFHLLNNYLDIRDAFACTVTKSQGSTYEKVFLDYSNIATCWDLNSLARLRYVGISRAKQEVVIYGL
jgi:exodeoxyribonuclease-5